MKPSTRKHPRYPVGILNAYGPDNTRATKLVAAVFKSHDPQAEPIMHRWYINQGDIRNDRTIAAEVAAFFKQHGVKQTLIYDRIIGCPHEEGVDYPMGRPCPRCPFWANLDRFTHEPIRPPKPTRTPEQILADLSELRTTQPLEALKSADAHRAALTDPLLQALERGLANPSGLPEGQRLLFRYAAYLLAKWREPRAYPLVVRWLSLPGEAAFELGGDTVTADGDRLLASVFDGNLDPIKALILNRLANERCRAQAVKALALLAVWAEVPREPVEECLGWLAREGLERAPGPVWNNLATACADMEAVRVFPDLRRALAEGLIDPSFVSPATLDEIERGPRGKWIEQQRERRPPIRDVAKATAERPELAHWPEPGVRSGPKVGRNDPCPCGSGKKYKHCCGRSNPASRRIPHPKMAQPVNPKRSSFS